MKRDLDKNLIPLEVALGRIAELDIKQKGSERAGLLEALGRTLAVDVVAGENMPRFDTSYMDGYAIAFDDFDALQGAGLKVSGVNEAGSTQAVVCEKGSAVPTYTGSVMPEGADTMVPIEDVEERGGRIFLASTKLAHKYSRGAYVKVVGTNYKAGSVMLSRGALIGTAELGLLSELNISMCEVVQKPRLGILCSGSELASVGQVIEPSSPRYKSYIRSVNDMVLYAAGQKLGCTPILYPLLRDDLDAIDATLGRAVSECDVVAISGGMSKGDFDYTQVAIAKHANYAFHGIDFKPGKMSAVAKAKPRAGDSPCIILGLAGNPNASFITFMVLGLPIIGRLLGRDLSPRKIKARLKDALVRRDLREEYLAASLERAPDGALLVALKSKINSSMINALIGDTIIAILKSGRGEFEAGEEIEVLLWKEVVG